MSFLNNSTAARINFARQVKAGEFRGFETYAEYDAEEKHCTVFAEAESSVIATASFALNEGAWRPSLRNEIEKMFHGSALTALRGGR